MPTASHTFARSNFDDSDEARPSSDFREATNISLESGQVFPTTGNVPVFSLAAPVAGTTLSLGCIEQEANDTAIVFYYNSAGAHRLVRYNPNALGGIGEETLVLEWEGLKLAPELVLQGRVIQGILVYRDATGEPRAINLARAEAGVYTAAYLAAEPYALHLVKVPPSTQPTAVRQTATTGDPREKLRLIATKAYQVAYRWHYIDGEVTPLSNLSPWCDILEDPSTTQLNVIVITLPSAVPIGVVEVDVLVREADTTIWQVATTIRRSDSGALASTVNFYGQILGGALTESETTKLAESCWPCEALEIAGSRVFEANILEGYPTPEPAFTAAVTNGNASTQQGTLYTLDVEVFSPGPPAQNDEPVPDVQEAIYGYFVLASGDYPNADSTYYAASKTVKNGQTVYVVDYGTIYTFDQAFNAPAVYGNEIYREVTVSQAPFTSSSSSNNDSATFHERSAYRVSIQFYDALGRSYGVSQPQTVFIPARTPGQLDYRSILATLTTTDAVKLNLEIPPGAYSYNFVVARNDQTVYFLQGEGADVFAYLGKVIGVRQDNSTYEYESIVDVTKNAHEKVWVDIGNFPATGQGYQWLADSGDRLRFLREDKDFLITNQVGDYLEVAWNDWPRQSLINGNSLPLIEIFSPNTSPSALYYERGPRLPILRTANGGEELRSYSKSSVLLEGDCFLVPINFPRIIKNSEYGDDPSNRKEYEAAKAPTLVESMVPPFRLAPSVTITRTIYDQRKKGGYFSYAFSFKGILTDSDPVTPDSTSLSTADTSGRTGANLLWLDISWGGRPAVIIPKELQQVRRNIIRFSNRKQQDKRINGLGSFEPLSFYDKLPQELGDIVRLSVADQAQTDGSVLLVNQTQGATSLYLGQQPIQADPNNQLLAISNLVIGGENTLRGGFGCVDAGTVVPYAGMLFFYSRERRELVRYNKGQTPLGLQYKYRTRLEELASRYQGGRVTGCFDPNRKEYLLTFHAVGELPGTTVVWSERREAWADQISFVPTATTGINAELLAWQGAQLHRHLPTAPVGTFFGVYTPPSLTFVPASGIAKTWQQVSVRSQAQWVPTLLTTPAGQRSRILPSWMKFVEGVWRAAIRRDENSPGMGADAVKALHSGRVLQSESLSVTLTCPAEKPGPITGAAVDFLINAGQAPNQ
jgi:hypothetical protein